MNYGFVKVAAAIPHVKVADCQYNAQQILKQIEEAEKEGVEIMIFPELSITAYTCADLFAQQLLLDESIVALKSLVMASVDKQLVFIIGMPLEIESSLLNCAIVIHAGKILGIVPKTYLPNYKEFYEMRWFASGFQYDTTILLCDQVVPVSPYLIFESSLCRFGIELCEDMWATIPPSSYLALEGADIIFNMSADNEGTGKHSYVRSLVSQQSARCLAGYVFASCGFGESTTDVVFSGNAFIYENGTLLASSQRFSLKPQITISEIDVERIRTERRVNTTFASCKALNCERRTYHHIPVNMHKSKALNLTRHIESHPFVPSGKELDERCEEIFAIQVSGLAQRLAHIHCKNVIIGISGGLDSTLALLVATRTFDKLGLDRQGIIGITMPGFGTTDRTYNNALHLMQSLGVTIQEIDIKQACLQHFNDIKHDINKHDVTYENAQARERTQILMDVANQMNGIVIGTGDLSELALGWATYNGDHMSMYAVNTSIPKTLVKHLVVWVANHDIDSSSRETLLDIADTPISPELIPADEHGNIRQKTEDLVGPYELHDFFLFQFFRFGFRPTKIFHLAQIAFHGQYDNEIIKKWLKVFFKRFFAQQFKRSCLPDGPKVGSVVLSPRGDWRMPSDASSSMWIDECERL